jgi:hypothetical protein
VKKDGPTLITWLLGRLAHAPANDACRVCGTTGAGVPGGLGPASGDGESVREWSGLCSACRRRWLSERLGSAGEGSP